jgi:hypothetical protein
MKNKRICDLSVTDKRKNWIQRCGGNRIKTANDFM